MLSFYHSSHGHIIGISLAKHPVPIFAFFRLPKVTNDNMSVSENGWNEVNFGRPRTFAPEHLQRSAATFSADGCISGCRWQATKNKWHVKWSSSKNFEWQSNLPEPQYLRLDSFLWTKKDSISPKGATSIDSKKLPHGMQYITIGTVDSFTLSQFALQIIYIHYIHLYNI